MNVVKVRIGDCKRPYSFPGQVVKASSRESCGSDRARRYCPFSKTFGRKSESNLLKSAALSIPGIVLIDHQHLELDRYSVQYSPCDAHIILMTLHSTLRIRLDRMGSFWYVFF
jgi:hypothetical protein